MQTSTKQTCNHVKSQMELKCCPKELKTTGLGGKKKENKQTPQKSKHNGGAGRNKNQLKSQKSKLHSKQEEHRLYQEICLNFPLP